MNQSRVPTSQEATADLVLRVDHLNATMKDMALNLALYLAKARTGPAGERINRLEPEFIRLVNGAVRLVQDVTDLLQRVRAERVGIQPPTGSVKDPDMLELRLKSLHRECLAVLDLIHRPEGR